MTLITGDLDLPASLSSAERWAVFTAAISAGLAALLSLVARVRRAVRSALRWWKATRQRFDALERLVNHELNPNSGRSLKDTVVRIDALSHDNARRLDRLESHLGVMADAQVTMWPAIEAVAMAEPPERNPHDPTD